MVFGCTSYQDSIDQNKTSDLVLPANDITDNASENYTFESPFAYIEYKNKTELKEIYYNFEKNGFGGCNAKLYLDKTGRLEKLQFVDMLEPGKNKENIFVRTSNCSGHNIILSGNREMIARWLANALAENSDITEVYNKNIEMTITELNYSGRIMDIRIDTPRQNNISGYPVKSVYDIDGIGIISSARIALSEYNGTKYYWITISRSYYPEPKIKIKPKIELKEAKEKLVENYNKKAEECKKEYSSASSESAPKPNCSFINRTILLTEDEEKNSRMYQSSLVVIARENDLLERLEYKLAWNMIMKRNCDNDAYVDAMTGELITIIDHCDY